MNRNDGIHQAKGTQILSFRFRHSHTIRAVATNQVAAPTEATGAPR